MYASEKEIFYINSRNRLTGTDNDFTIKLDFDSSKYDRVVLLDASIPRSYYIVQSGYNTFILNEGGADLTITLPAGNYTRTSLKNVLTDILNTTGSFTYAISYRNISSTYDDGKFLFTVSGNSGVQPSFTFGTNFYELLGFEASTTYNFSADTLQTPNVINLNHEATIYIHSDICQNNNNNILDDILTTHESSFSYLVYENPYPYETSKKLFGGNNNTFRFSITDEDDRLIDLNGLNWILTIMVYKNNDISNLIKSFIKMKTLTLQ